MDDDRDLRAPGRNGPFTCARQGLRVGPTAGPPNERRHPVVLDTSVLIQDVLRRSDGKFTGLPWLAQGGAITIVAPRHVEAEVYRRLPKAARETGRPELKVQETLESVHLPLIRFVDLPGVFLEDPDLARVLARDPDDAPLAHLAKLLAPSLVLSSDKDLIDEGFGHQDWVTSVMLLGKLTELDQLVWSGAQFAYLSTFLPMVGVWKLGAWLAKSELGIIAMLVATAAGFIFRSGVKNIGASAKERVGPAMEKTAVHVTEVFGQLASAQADYQARLVLPAGAATVETDAARLLAGRARPISSDQVHHALVGRHEATLAETRAMLREHPAFVGQRGKGYQLGRISMRAAPEVVDVAAP